MNKFDKQIVGDFDAGKRVDVWLAIISGVSRSKVQKYLKSVGVLINDEIVLSTHYILQTDDVVMVPEEFIVVEDDAVVENPETAVKRVKAGKMIDLADILIFENDDVLVVNKPAGVLVHPTDSSFEYTLMDSAVAYDPKIAEVGDKPLERAGIVHRLDRMTSGIMILARNQEAFLDLKHKFKKRFVEKKYYALVNGSLDKDHDVLRLNIARSKKLGRMVARPENQEGRSAITEYNVIDRFANATLAEVDIHTGRTHQIRAHFHALGNPVVGDELYVIKNQKTIPFSRLWLHAYRLKLALPGASEASEFVAQPPAIMTNLLETLHRI